MSELLFLGRPAFDPKPFTRIDPLALAEAGAWRVYDEWSEVLPTEGRAFAPRLQGYGAGDLVAFRIEPSAKGDQDRDHYVVAQPSEVYEVLDFRAVDPEFARRHLVEVGQPRLLPGTDAVVAALSDGICVTVPMVRHPSRPVWVAEISGLERLQAHAFDMRLFAGDQVMGHWVTLPGLTVGPAVDTVNWCRDTEFLASVLKRIRKAGSQSLNAPTRSQIAQLVTQLDRSEALPGSGTDLAPMRKRLLGFAPSLLENVRAVDEIVQTLGNLPSVRDRLAAEMAERRIELEREIRQDLEERFVRELEDSFPELTAQRDGLAQEVTSLASEIETKRIELQDQLAAVGEARSAIAEELTRLLSDLGVSPDDDPTIASLANRLASRLGEAGAAFEIAASGGPPWTVPRASPGEPKPWTAFDQTLESTAARWGFSAADLKLADAAARGGRLVVLPEEDATAFVSCYSDLVAGGGFSRHVLDPSVISLDDLWQKPGSDRHGCFAKCWASARLAPSRFHVLLLEGLHRTPTAFWVPGLTEVLDDVRRPPNLLVFAGLGISSLDPGREWDGTGATALKPVPIGGVPSRPLGEALGAPQAASQFDPLAAPFPTREEMMTFFAAEEAEASQQGLAAACRVYRAAWAFGVERATGLAQAAAVSKDGSLAGSSAGRAWLRERLAKKD